ncbi:hypothetical protein CERZMDRAFT_122026 [Cercospora zeae-maydis SCOH1-5]|uniref:Uncharacterized protein n=1 Tax=Cercospora zeae-maydis SCOH1-5 TaxID=717836 RepID=A0A6A6F7Z1_9PEZI|nr:hypothetical protein CERZMDRAFT_122026 [Cercospora zeae-maydis SCOH1-5]
MEIRLQSSSYDPSAPAQPLPADQRFTWVWRCRCNSSGRACKRRAECHAPVCCVREFSEAAWSCPVLEDDSDVLEIWSRSAGGHRYSAPSCLLHIVCICRISSFSHLKCFSFTSFRVAWLYLVVRLAFAVQCRAGTFALQLHTSIFSIAMETCGKGKRGAMSMPCTRQPPIRRCRTTTG